jgi:signal transduction histidine kinase
MHAPSLFGASLLLSGALALWPCLAPAASAAQAPAPATRHLLFLGSYQSGYNWSDDLIAGIRQVIEAEPYPIELWIEHMDSRRFPPGESEALVEELLHRKYRQRTFDLILASDDAALAFLVKRHDALFPGVPVVFMGINDWKLADGIDRRVYTGLLERFLTRAMVELVLRVRPQTRRLVVVADAGQTAVSQVSDYRALAAQRPGFGFELLDGSRLSLDQILEALRRGGPTDAVLTTAFTRDVTGRYYAGDEALARIAAAAPAPVFSASVNRLGQGLLAGSENVGLQHGREAGRKAIDVLRGGAPSAVPIEPAGNPRFIVDYGQMERWTIDPALVPADAILVNVPSSFYSANKYLIWGGAGFILLQAAVIVTLAVNVSRRRRAEQALAAHAERLSESNESLQRVNASLQAETLERLQAQEQLRQAQKMEAIGRLAGGVAHDFNNLLTVIASYTALALEDLEPSHPVRPHVKEVERAGERASRLTQQLLAFSRKQVLIPVVVSLNDVVRGLEPMLRRLIREDVALDTRLAAAATWVRVDAGQIEQVIVNLATNARDSMPEGGRLVIETQAAPPQGEVRLLVRDSGAGMEPEVRARAFEPFFTTKPQGRGVGLGLSTVYGIVCQSGGRIAVDSAPGRGTVFTVTLPASPPDATHEVRPSLPVRRPRSAARILLVEDQDEVRSLAAHLLRREGHQVTDCPSAEDALAHVQAHPGPIDLLLTDMVMRGLSGRVLAERLREGQPGLRVLLMTGYTDEMLTQIHRDMGFLPKPFTPESLIGAVDDALRGEPARGGLIEGPTVQDGSPDTPTIH